MQNRLFIYLINSEAALSGHPVNVISDSIAQGGPGHNSPLPTMAQITRTKEPGGGPLLLSLSEG
jgi:hypothetical protein